MGILSRFQSLDSVQPLPGKKPTPFSFSFCWLLANCNGRAKLYQNTHNREEGEIFHPLIQYSPQFRRTLFCERREERREWKMEDSVFFFPSFPSCSWSPFRNFPNLKDYVRFQTKMPFDKKSPSFPPPSSSQFSSPIHVGINRDFPLPNKQTPTAKCSVFGSVIKVWPSCWKAI